MYSRLYRGNDAVSSAKGTVSSAKGKVKQPKEKKRKKQSKPFSKDKRYFNKVFGKIKKYGKRRTKLTQWEKDLAFIWLEKARKKLEEKIKKEREKREKEEEDAKDEEIIEDINVKSVDFHIEKNAIAHHTDEYFATCDIDTNNAPKERELVVRRGQPFTMTITCDRPYEKNKYDMQLIFKTGLDPKEHCETRARIEIDESGTEAEDTDNWHARLLNPDAKTVDMEIEVLTPNDCIIGEWMLEVLTTFSKDDKEVKQLSWECPDDITIILNPWCKDDTCYMEDEKLLEEYVLNPYGCVYTGSSRWQTPKEWFFGQFEEGILEICLILLRQAFGSEVNKKMGDTVFISRAIAQIVNECNDNGVLIGNWSGNYEGGKSPTVWAGSVKILKEFYKGKNPVKYGQCWVFSGVTTTVCRALGLPCRSITNFASAHDTDGSTTIDRIYTRDDFGELEKKDSDDSIWNFHVWNEVWMTRPDLPVPTDYSYDGWQAIDATPQELSDGKYTCGPASLNAIIHGDCTLPYDTAFIFSEVNSDICEYEEVGNFSFDLLNVFTDRVGKMISTKVPNGEKMMKVDWIDENREDVTCHYKFEEGSQKERDAVKNAKLAAKFSFGDYEAPPKDLKITLKDIERVNIGDDFDIAITVKNISQEKKRRTMSKLSVIVHTCKYNGESLGKVKKDQFIGIALEYDQEETFITKVRFSDYWEHLCEYGNMKVVVTSKCNETGRTHVENDEFRICRPDLIVKAQEKCKVGDEMDVEVLFKNPVPILLTQCNLFVDSNEAFEILSPHEEDKIKLEDVQPQGEMKIVVKMKALCERRRKAYTLFNFDSRELHDICGSTATEIKKEF